MCLVSAISMCQYHQCEKVKSFSTRWFLWRLVVTVSAFHPNTTGAVVFKRHRHWGGKQRLQQLLYFCQKCNRRRTTTRITLLRAQFEQNKSPQPTRWAQAMFPRNPERYLHVKCPMRISVLLHQRLNWSATTLKLQFTGLCSNVGCKYS